ncbi:MAG: TRAP transporter permease, partial [Bilophila wadsworthia]
TIPLMKKVGYRAPFAGAVEAVASTGGQLMPPVMGTAAFLMADLSGAGYLNVAKAALLPAILYYLALLVMIHFEAVKNDLGKLSPDMVPETKSVVSRLYYLVPIAVLILLLGMGRSVVFCANIATLSIVLLAMLKAETRFTFKSFIEALVASSRGALMVSACCACSGLIVGVLSLTGIGYKFINLITILAGDSLFLLMVYLMLTSFVLGMGIPTTPAYIVVATLGAPALIKAGAPQLVAHMFVFYYDPVPPPRPCVAAFAGLPSPKQGHGDGLYRLKLGIVAFIVPYMFVYQPALLGIGETPEIIWAAITAIIGVIGIAGGMQSWLLCSTSAWERAFLLIGGLTLIYPGLSTDIIGFGLLFSVGIVQMLRRRRAPIAA